MRIQTPTGHVLDISFRYKTYDSKTTFRMGKTFLDSRKRVETICFINLIHNTLKGKDRFEKILPFIYVPFQILKT